MQDRHDGSSRRCLLYLQGNRRDKEMSDVEKALNSWLPTIDSNEVINITPEMIERRFIYLARLGDEAFEELRSAEMNYQSTTAAYELAMAESRIMLSNISKPNGKNYTVDEREDNALIDNKEKYLAHSIAEAIVKAARANVKRIEMQVGINQSTGTNIRTFITSSS
jgi:hypothetical protein